MDPEAYSEYWRPFLRENRDRINHILESLHDANGKWTRLPAKDRVFAALSECSVPKVIVLGQDPYPTPGHAMGLSFSLPNGISIPPNNSLRNMFLELERQGYPTPKVFKTTPDGRRYRSPTGDLTSWAHQGFLLLNTSLTVLPGKAGSDLKVWESFTSDLIRYVARTDGPEDPGCCFVLWGGHARKLRSLIDPAAHLIIEGAHPSPLSAHLFKGNDHFRRITAFLQDRYGDTMRWDPSDPLPEEPCEQHLLQPEGHTEGK
jgi:uracil-DNA glycosylase